MDFFSFPMLVNSLQNTDKNHLFSLFEFLRNYQGYLKMMMPVRLLSYNCQNFKETERFSKYSRDMFSYCKQNYEEQIFVLKCKYESICFEVQL